MVHFVQSRKVSCSLGGAGVGPLRQLGSDRTAHGLDLSAGAEEWSAGRVGAIIPFVDEAIALRAYGVVVSLKVRTRDGPEPLSSSVEVKVSLDVADAVPVMCTRREGVGAAFHWTEEAVSSNSGTEAGTLSDMFRAGHRWRWCWAGWKV